MEEYFHNEPMSIVLHGISMGGATVLMVSGEELSDNVKAIVADCSYTSAYDEFKYYLKNKGCPPFLLLPSATLLSKKTVGYNFKQAVQSIKSRSLKHLHYLYMVTRITLCLLTWH